MGRCNVFALAFLFYGKRTIMPSFTEIYAANAADLQKVIDTFKDTNEERETTAYIEEYEGARTRRNESVGKRADKVVGEGDNRKTVPVARLVFGFPKKIVRTATAFKFGGDMTVSARESNEGVEEFKRRWEKELKMHGVIKEFARTVMVETKAALLFYPVKKTTDPEVKLRVKLLNANAGDFFPHFDDYGDMDAFLWKFKAKDMEGKEVECVNIYTAEQIMYYVKGDGGWAARVTTEGTGVIPNLFGKIPVVYSEQDKPEWEEITSLMDNFEMRVSRLSDTNSYFAEPLLKLFGDVVKMPGKETTGKMVQFEQKKTLDGKIESGDAAYLTWDQTPESIKLELETMRAGIYSMSSTPDLSFDNVKGLGASVSGIALRLMFLDAFLKASDREDLDQAVQRMVAVVVAGIANIANIKFKKQLEENWIEVTFGSVLPDDTKEAIEVLVRATGDQPILSRKTGVSLNPLVKDTAAEVLELDAQLKATAAQQGTALVASMD
jgi:SPP1 family phage portal protein